MRIKTVVSILLLVLSSCGAPNENRTELTELAEEMNARCPEMVDDETRFDRACAFGNNLEMSFTLVHMDKDLMNVNEFTEALKTYLRSNVKNQFRSKKIPVDSVFLQKNNVNLHYFYFDKYKKIVSDIVITPQEYR